MICPLAWELKGVCRVILKPNVTDFMRVLNTESHYVHQLIAWDGVLPEVQESPITQQYSYKFQYPNANFDMTITIDSEYLNPTSEMLRSFMLDHVIMCKIPFVEVVVFWISHNKNRFNFVGPRFQGINDMITSYGIFQLRHHIDNNDGFELYKSVNSSGVGLSPIEMDAIAVAKFSVFKESVVSVAESFLNRIKAVKTDLKKFIWIVHPDIPEPKNKVLALKAALNALDKFAKVPPDVMGQWMSDMYGDPYDELDEEEATDFAQSLAFLEGMYQKHENMSSFWTNFSVYNKALSVMHNT